MTTESDFILRLRFAESLRMFTPATLAAMLGDVKANVETLPDDPDLLDEVAGALAQELIDRVGVTEAFRLLSDAGFADNIVWGPEGG